MSGPEAGPAPTRYALWIEYVGTAFHGSQAQQREPTVQSELERALGRLSKRAPPPRVTFCGRTDAGVHATAACVHADVVRLDGDGAALPALDEAAVLNALNHALPAQRLGVLACRRVPMTFDAKRSACERTYIYRIRCAAPPSLGATDGGARGGDGALGVLPPGVRTRAEACPSLCRRGWLSSFEKQRALCLPEPLDVVAMRAAAAVLVGRHDFSALRSPRCNCRFPERTLRECAVILEPPDALADLSLEGGVGLAVRVVARAFLRQQVRRIVAVLLEAGRGRLAPHDVGALLASREPARCPVAAPAHGLYLACVRYPPAAFGAAGEGEEGRGGSGGGGGGGASGEEEEDEEESGEEGGELEFGERTQLGERTQRGARGSAMRSTRFGGDG